ncbi:MAG: flotillin [Candidatus Hydrogenedentes bacterium]|nr:flotillin [Candidatus Hydrogenedentota bacterium]
MSWAIIAIPALLAIMIFTTIVLMSTRYKRCPSNRVLVIYGKVGGGGSSRCIHGGAAFVWPLIQDYDFLSLEPIQIEVPLKDALSMENIRVNVPSVFTVALGTEPTVMQNAAIRLLNLGTTEIKKQAEDIIFGQLRQVIASMQIEDINRDREKFLHNILVSLEPELRKIGLVLINVNITDITDASGYIMAIGKRAAAEAIQKARGDVADQEKLGEVHVAEAERDKQVQVAEANKIREVGIRDALKQKAVSIANLDKEQQIGEQAAAFERESSVKDAERAMRINVAAANAKAIEGENLSKAAIADSNAELLVRQSDAYQTGETRKREAEAAVLEAQNHALAKAAVAESERVEQEQRAKLEAPAKAQKARTIVEAEAEAERRRIQAQGEAAAIFLKLDAEARGSFEILAKKGEGLKRIVDACGGAQAAFQMLMLEHMDMLAQTSAQAISNIKFDKVVVWENGGDKGQGSTAGFLQNMAHTMPPMMQVMKEVAGVEFPDYLVKFTQNETEKKPAEGATS